MESNSTLFIFKRVYSLYISHTGDSNFIVRYEYFFKSSFVLIRLLVYYNIPIIKAPKRGFYRIVKTRPTNSYDQYLIPRKVYEGIVIRDNGSFTGAL
jgi:hypothetical protein